MTPKVLELDTLKPSTRSLSSAMKEDVYSLVDFFYITIPKKLIYEVKRVEAPIDIDQTYFWTDEWQKEEKAIDEDYKKGKFKRFSNPQDAIAFLRG